MKRVNAITVVTLVSGLTVAGCAHEPSGQDSERLLTVDHFVSVRSSIPEIAGQNTRLYVRERVKAGTIARGTDANRVVLFIHGAGTPAEVAFDVPHQDYSWMAYLARAGFDVFSMEHTGYGRSTRPAVMDDPCNLAPKQQAGIVRSPAGCKPNPPRNLTPITAEWEEIDAVVDYLRTLRGVKTVSLVAWSRGGPRAGGYAALHPAVARASQILRPR